MTSQPADVQASAPAKIILMGEHAAVYGQPALVAALGLRTEASVWLSEASPDPARSGLVTVELPDLECTSQLSWDDIDTLRATAFDASVRHRLEEAGFVPLADLNTNSGLPTVALFVGTALGEVCAEWRADVGGETLAALRSRIARIRVTSLAPIGAGCGSSAAVASTVVAALDDALRRVRGEGQAEVDAALLHRVERMALQAERYQHGRPSGVDTAAVLRGSTHRVQMRSRNAGESQCAEGNVASSTDRRELAIEPIRFPPGSFDRFSVIFTGAAPDSTGTVVDAVRQALSANPDRINTHIEDLGRLSIDLESAMKDDDRPAIGTMISEGERALEALGVVPKPVIELITEIERRGGFAKVSGAGSLQGPGAGVVLVYDPERTVDLSALARERASVELLPAEIGAAGLWIE